MDKDATMVEDIIQVVMEDIIQEEVAHHIKEDITAIVQVIIDMEFIQLPEGVEAKTAYNMGFCASMAGRC